jgi:hypothetical protein
VGNAEQRLNPHQLSPHFGADVRPIDLVENVGRHADQNAKLAKDDRTIR